MKTVTFGEIMLRLAPQGNLRFLQEPSFQATFGGGEANVAVSLSSFGVQTSFVTKIPDNDIGDAAIRQLLSFGVNVENIARGGKRLGIYYLEKGASVRPSKVIYDRAYSSFALSTERDYPWEKILQNAKWFHFTGITPALGDNVAKITETALKTAKKLGIKVSCDLNYRKNLWSKEKAMSTMSPLMEYVDICIANEEDAADVFNITSKNSDINSGKLNKEGYIDVCNQLISRFGFDLVAITLRESFSASDNNWSAMLYGDKQAFFSKTYPLHIVDRVGGGDSFGAGLIYGLQNNYSKQDALEFATAASALKHTIEGDCNRVNVNEVKSLIKNGGSGRVLR